MRICSFSKDSYWCVVFTFFTDAGNSSTDAGNFLLMPANRRNDDFSSKMALTLKKSQCKYLLWFLCSGVNLSKIERFLT